jgi:xylobiose transport system permease protein
MTKATKTLHSPSPGRFYEAGRPGLVWALPGAIFFAAFAVLPLVLVVGLSFATWDGLGAPAPAGLSNWVQFFSDPTVIKSSLLSLLLTIFGVGLQLPLSILLGTWAAGNQRNRAVLSAIYFIPLLLSSAAVAVVWKSLLDPNFGIPGQLAKIIGGDGSFLGTQSGAITILVFVGLWQFTPFHTLIYQGGVRAIPEVLYQAAAIDGAGRYRRFWSITLPQLRNTMITSTILMVVGSLTTFDTVLILTGGGPGTDTMILPLYMYQTGFQSYQFGYSSVVAVALVVVATVISLVMVRLSGYDKMRSSLEGL